MSLVFFLQTIPSKTQKAIALSQKAIALTNSTLSINYQFASIIFLLLIICTDYRLNLAFLAVLI